jgi:ubiquinone/menaquinone biosynthesis C-methylase UbiE
VDEERSADVGKTDTPPVLAYDALYAQFASKIAADVRHEAMGEDIGQNSWTTAEEYRQFIRWLKIGPSAHVLDVGSGSGGPALFVAQESGCAVTGVDINENGIVNARRATTERGLQSRVRFEQVDAGGALPFSDETFNAIICNDAINHLRDRPRVLADWARVLRREGKVLFTDPITVTGIIDNNEIAIRSSIGYFLFTPQGVNERLLADAGLTLSHREDVTENVASIARRWYEARARRREDLARLEGQATFDGSQRFLWTAHTLAAERRLSRFVFVARKP